MSVHRRAGIQKNKQTKKKGLFLQSALLGAINTFLFESASIRSISSQSQLFIQGHKQQQQSEPLGRHQEAVLDSIVRIRPCSRTDWCCRRSSKPLAQPAEMLAGGYERLSEPLAQMVLYPPPTLRSDRGGGVPHIRRFPLSKRAALDEIGASRSCAEPLALTSAEHKLRDSKKKKKHSKKKYMSGRHKRR